MIKGEVKGLTTTFGKKTITFLLLFDQEAFKLSKITIQFLNLCILQ